MIELLIFIISHAILISWIVFVFKHQGTKTLFIRLTTKQIIWLVGIEVILFLIMYLNYEMTKSADVADDFAWHYSITYARGVLPLAGLASLNDKIFTIKDPVFSCLVVGLIMDYIILFLFTKLADIIKK
jgi:hypothetical protein